MQQFVSWFTKFICEVNVAPATSRAAKRFGITSACIGVEAALQQYKWNGKAWCQTKVELFDYRSELQEWLNSSNDDNGLLKVCAKIIRWGGGERGIRNNGLLFLADKAKKQLLRKYLLNCRDALSLDSSSFQAIERMDSMLTKVHSLAAQDILPIYDSRVAYTMASFFEIYLRTHQNRISAESIFPVIADPSRSRLPEGSISKPKILDRSNRSTSHWCSAMVRLGTVFKHILNEDRQLFREEGGLSDRAHALEASLFMIGYKPEQLASYF